jgi:anaerobic carbon-monoxide dehydrogenase iron sulfur subunit
LSYKRIFHSSPEACTGCRICELVCSLNHEKTGINPKRSMIRIHEDRQNGIYTPFTCQLCSDAPCIEVCPSAALSRNAKTGVIVVDEEKCSGCELCIEVCVYGAMSLHPDKNIAVVCDLCGGEPKCVKYCMQKALVFLKPEEYDAAKSKLILEK